MSWMEQQQQQQQTILSHSVFGTKFFLLNNAQWLQVWVKWFLSRQKVSQSVSEVVVKQSAVCEERSYQNCLEQLKNLSFVYLGFFLLFPPG